MKDCNLRRQEMGGEGNNCFQVLTPETIVLVDFKSYWWCHQLKFFWSGDHQHTQQHLCGFDMQFLLLVQMYLPIGECLGWLGGSVGGWVAGLVGGWVGNVGAEAITDLLFFLFGFQSLSW